MSPSIDERQRITEPRGGSIMPWIVGLIIIAILVVGGFFLFGGDADVDTKGGDIDVELPETDVDVDPPDIDVEAPDVDVDPGSVEVTEGDAEADAG